MQPMLNIAVRAARAAGKVLLRYFERANSLNVTTKGLNDFVSEVDRAAEETIIDALRSAYPEHGILAEESGAQPGRSDYQWIIDPLDGTTNYLHGFPQFSVSIALKHRDILTQGVVYDPLREEMFTASRGGGAFLNDRRIRVSRQKNLNGALLGTGFPFRDLAQLDVFLSTLRTFISAQTAGVRRPGSAALDFAYVASGRLDGFWEFGLAEWDYAAGALLVQEAGGSVSDMFGGAPQPKTGNVVAANPRLHATMLQALRPHLTPEEHG